MADQNKEVMRYELDISDVEAKLQRMKGLLDGVKAGRASGGDTSEQEAELSKLAGASERASVGLGKAGEASMDFDRKGEKLVKGTLGLISPQLAGAADMALDLAEGFDKVTPALVGVAGAGVAIGVIAAAIAHLAEVAKDAQEKLERLAKAKIAHQDKTEAGIPSFADAAMKLGLDASQGAPAMNAAFLEMSHGQGGTGPIPIDTAREMAVAQEFAKAHGIPVTRDELGGGIVAFGGKMPDAANGQEYEQNLRSVIEAGRQPGAQQSFRSWVAAKAEFTKREAAEYGSPGLDDEQRRQETALQRKLTDGDIEPDVGDLTRKLLRDPKAREKASRAEKDRRENTLPILDNVYISEWTGATSNKQRIALDVADQVERESGSAGPLKPAPVTPIQPVTNVYNYTQGTVFNGGGNARMNPFYDAKVSAPAAGMMDRSQP